MRSAWLLHTLPLNPSHGVKIALSAPAGPSQEHIKMPNRSELAAITRPKAKAAVARADATPEDYWSAREPGDTGLDGIWLVSGLCVIGVLVSIDFAAYFQLLDQLPMIVAQVP